MKYKSKSLFGTEAKQSRNQELRRRIEEHAKRKLADDIRLAEVPSDQIAHVKKSIFHKIRDALFGYESIEAKLARAPKPERPMMNIRRKRRGPSKLRRQWAIRGRR